MTDPIQCTPVLAAKILHISNSRNRSELYNGLKESSSTRRYQASIFYFFTNHHPILRCILNETLFSKINLLNVLLRIFYRNETQNMNNRAQFWRQLRIARARKCDETVFFYRFSRTNFFKDYSRVNYT